MFSRFKPFFEKYERHLTSAAFLLGFIWDSLTLTRVDLLYDNIVLTSYLIIAAVGIILINSYEAGKMRNQFMANAMRFLPLMIQFAFGGLFSGYIIFYTRSASLVASWPFILFLAFLFIGNELFRKRYARLTFQLSIFFIAAFSYFIFSVPVVIGSIGVHIFFASGILAIAIVALLVKIIKKIFPSRIQESRAAIVSSIAAIYLIFNVAYFSNVIPPIPLSLKHIGIYHDLVINDGAYSLSYEKAEWFEFKKISRNFNRFDNEPVYIYSAVFAPDNIRTNIFHKWLKFDDASNKWIATDRIQLRVAGGRAEGYRGYSYKTNMEEGRWRVDVETPRGQLIGRITFNVSNSKERPKLVREHTPNI